MDPALKASSEALDFYLKSNEILIEDLSILIIQGAPHSYTQAFKNCKVDVISYHADHVERWKSNKITPNAELQSEYDLVIQFVPKSESETNVEFSKGIQHLSSSGQFIGVVHNRMGATRYKKLMQQSFSEFENTSKSKCRVLHAEANKLKERIDFSHLSTPQTIANTEYKTLPGVYGNNGVDAGSQLLASILKDEYWSGFGADIGCGYGYLTGEILKTRHKIKEVWLYEVDSRALQMAQQNLEDKVKLNLNWVDITQQIPCDRQLHWAIMNPPFHSGTNQDFSLGQKFIEQASKVLRPGSPLFMVANQHLPYEDTLFEHFRSVVKLTEKDGFKCYKAIK